MKTIFLTGIFGIALLTGCEKSNTKTVTITTPDEKKSVSVDYSYSQKDDFVTKLKGARDDIKDQMSKLSDKMKSSTESARTEMQPKLDALKEKSKNLDVQIDKAQNATAETWDKVKAGAQTAFDDAKQGFIDAKNWAADKLKQ